MTQGHGHKANEVFAPRGAWQSGASADFFALGYEPFGALLPGRNYSSSNYRFGFQGQEKDDEVHGSTGTSYDFGARMLDPRVGRWLSLDPLGAKYPAITPYAFALNSPLLFMDPNGKEGVVTIQRDPQGGGTITISTIVYITGAGATQGKADEFNAGYSRFAPSSTYTDASGQKFDVNINITFQYAPDRSAIELQRGENILELTDENLRSHATGVGGTVRTLDPKTGEWTESFSAELGQLARLGKNDHNAQTETHEVLHLLGLSDRYKDIPLFGRNDQNERVQTGEVSVGNPGFQDDIMGTGIEFSPVHTENYGNYILGQESSKGNQFILDRFVDLDASGNLIGGEQPKKP